MGKMSQELELVRVEVTETADEMELLKKGILSNSSKIERAKQAIAKAQAILVQLELEQQADITKLETLIKKSESFQERETELTQNL